MTAGSAQGIGFDGRSRALPVLPVLELDDALDELLDDELELECPPVEEAVELDELSVPPELELESPVVLDDELLLESVELPDELELLLLDSVVPLEEEELARLLLLELAEEPVAPAPVVEPESVSMGAVPPPQAESRATIMNSARRISTFT